MFVDEICSIPSSELYVAFFSQEWVKELSNDFSTEFGTLNISILVK